MEPVAALPPELLTGAMPPPGGAAPLLRSSDPDPAAAPAALPFDLLLAMLKAVTPAGESLPAAGNSLPAAATPVDGTAAESPPTAPTAPASPTAATAADLLARLRLAAATGSVDAGPATTSQPPNSASPSIAMPFASIDATQCAASPPPPATPAPATTAAPPAAEPAAADVMAALAASLPRATNADRPAPRSASLSADVAASASPAATGVEPPAAAVATAINVSAPVQPTESTDRPPHRDPTLEALPLPSGAASDTAGTAANGGSIPPPLAHASSTPGAHAADAAASAAQGAPIDTRAEHWRDAFASRVQMLVDQHVGEARIKLNPPELGAVDVKISLVEDKTFVHLTTATTTARDELSQSLPRLRELLSSSGLSLGGATVQGGQGGRGEGQRAAHGNGASALRPFGLADDDLAPVRAVHRAAGRIDLFA
jgi:flagellar hook-length control protein FliK